MCLRSGNLELFCRRQDKSSYSYYREETGPHITEKPIPILYWTSIRFFQLPIWNIYEHNLEVILWAKFLYFGYPLQNSWIYWNKKWTLKNSCSSSKYEYGRDIHLLFDHMSNSRGMPKRKIGQCFGACHVQTKE
jgi:hypothetical protein